MIRRSMHSIAEWNKSGQDVTSKGTLQETINAEECVAHLKLLTTFASLRHEISTTDELFGIYDSMAFEFSGAKSNLAKARIREKRWAVYVSKAADRFIAWWKACVPDQPFGVTSGLGSGLTERIAWTEDNLPPLDVLMVWHSYMLHPRAFLEDCLRLSKMGLWSSGLPWNAVTSCIEPKTFNYRPTDRAIQHFEAKTGLAWNSLEDPPSKELTCPRCKGGIDAPWTTATTGVGYDPDVAFAHCSGFTDRSFLVQCPGCRFRVTHGSLRVSRFRHDAQALLKDGNPMPGTLLSLRGTPAEKTDKESSFPNRLIKMGIKVDLLKLTDPAEKEDTSIESIRGVLEQSLKSRWLIRQVNKTVLPASLSHTEGIFIRRMMSRYWDNASPFSLDLTGAVIRQGAFIEKIEQLGWIDSPRLQSIMTNMIAKYRVFFNLIVQNPDRAAVPTLDVDLAWHTHQLSPSRYYAFSTNQTNGVLIDHDDKVDENKISDAFEWTSKQYQKLTGGKIYSECTCWYCEAVRESHSQPLSALSSTLNARANASSLCLDDGSSTEVTGGGGPHISSHNAVRAQGQTSFRASEIKADALKKNWEKVLKRNRRASLGKAKRQSIVQDEIPTQVRIWGVACDVPNYGPHMRDPGVHGDLYPSSPLCMSVAPGAPGNCVAGTDREIVGRGGCVSAATREETPGRHRGRAACQGVGYGGDGMGGGGMF